MPYRPISYGHITDKRKQDVFRRASLYLGDVYSMLKVKPRAGSHDGGCNFSIVLVLMCVVDALSSEIYPGTPSIRKKGEQEARFKKLLRDELPWGPTSKGWIDKGSAAKWLYCEFRNPLTHNLGMDQPSNTPLKNQHAIGKVGHLPAFKTNTLDAMKKWNPDWPLMKLVPYRNGQRVGLACSGLYWAIKRMTQNLAARTK